MRPGILGLVAMALMVNSNGIGNETPKHKREPTPDYKRKKCKSCAKLEMGCHEPYASPKDTACARYTKRK